MKATGISFFVILGIVVVGAGVWLAVSTTDRSELEPGGEAVSGDNLRESAEGGVDEGLAEEEELSAEGLVEPEVTELVAVEGATGEGIAVRAYDGATFFHGVNAQIADPPAGFFYEGWLVQKQPELTFISTGKLENTEGQYVLTFDSEIDYSSYPDVVITQETEANGLDNQPEAHILEGSFN